ncbi:BTB/POZ domain containing protein [Tritrichomonas foetus]|uniref:BTB/POZ domain containing protein n=1 Tax=Tritrichomonas foetus TaxID=1144522 RepID=A0A1J4JA57_9EUKA|nr:BTB/POZ domain containing protein [Tritrichomonas foetus]|eukprot:OHS94515.1 BTB/POZ domain containing protein [Tritrichomonas foetus]
MLVEFDSSIFPEFDQSFVDEEKNSPFDCVIYIQNEKNSAHSNILSKYSLFFKNAFTSGLIEDKKREVFIDFNPANCFEKIFTFFYSGKIAFDFSEIMIVFAISQFYGVDILTKVIENHLNDNINSNNLINLIQQCYDYELNAELHFLIPYIVNYFPLLNIKKLSENLDIPIFCEVLKRLNNSFEETINLLTDFLGDYKCTQQDYDEIKKILDKNDPLVKIAFHSIQPKWAEGEMY